VSTYTIQLALYRAARDVFDFTYTNIVAQAVILIEPAVRQNVRLRSCRPASSIG
jgi:hypothetical protein